MEVVCKDVATLGDISNAIFQMKKQNNRITSLWIRAHGISTGFTLNKFPKELPRDPMQSPYISNLYPYYALKLLKPALSLIEKDATIVLGSCSTGRINAEGAKSIAQSIATLAPGRRVIAPTQKVSAFETRFISVSPFEIGFYKPKLSRASGRLRKIANAFYKAFFLFGGPKSGTSITARYRCTVLEKDEV